MDTHDAAAGDAVIGQEEEEEEQQPLEQKDDPSSESRASPKLQRAPSEQQQEADGAKRGEGSSASLAESAQSERVLTTSAEDGEAGAPLPPPQAQEGSGDGAPPTLGTLESIEVMVRVRPLLEHEVLRGARCVVECGPPSEGSTSSTSTSSSMDSEEGGASYRYVSIRAHSKLTLRCKYDHVFGPEAGQPQIYQRVKAGVKRAMEGYNSTIMAYGQTGSGKTHSMFGSPGKKSPGDDEGYAAARPGRATPQLPEGAGIIPRAIADIFTMARRREAAQLPPVAIYCSFVQIYNEQLFDMLRDGSRGNPLVIHEDGNHEIYVEGLSEYRVRNMDECLVLLRMGEEHRAIRETHMNQASSRSHSIFHLVLEQELPPDDERMAVLREQHGDPLPAGCILRSKLNLVDLAGSEKWDTRQDIASQHARELANINSSLFTLGRCISALCAKGGAPAHVPFRESKLTRLIQDSLGGNTKTYLLATLSPTPGCVEESISTLKFADRAKQVMMYVRPNERPAVDRALVDRLQREVARLRATVLKLSEAQVLAGREAEEKEEGGRLLLEERVRDLERHLGRERTEAERLRQALTEAHAARDGLMRGLRLQAETARQQQHLQQQGSIDGTSTSSSSSASQPSSAELASVTQKLEEAEELNRRLSGLLARFFSFEIQEAELRRALADLMPNVDAFLAARKAPVSPRRDHHPHQHQHQHQRQPRAGPSPHPHASALALTSPLPTAARAQEPPGWSSRTITTTRALARQATPPRRPPPAQLSPISCGHQRCAGNQHLPPEEAPSPHSPWAGAGAGQHGSSSRSSDPWHVPRERRFGASLEKEAREARHSPFVAGGRGGKHDHQQHQPRWRSPHGMAAGGSPFPLDGQVVTRGRERTPTSPPPVALLGAAAAYGSEDEEQRLAEQLQRARQRMQRHIKLQEWLIRKEQVELEAMEREEAGRRLAEQARCEADLRFREHARRQKKKLEAYYAGLAAGTVPGEEAGALGPSPPPILDLRPRKALP